MTFAEFKATLSGSKAPISVDGLLLALWHDARGDWNAAHQVAQDIDTSDGAWVHAYLHRKEGDLSNASYWYNRANQKMPAASLEREWESIVATLLLR